MSRRLRAFDRETILALLPVGRRLNHRRAAREWRSTLSGRTSSAAASMLSRVAYRSEFHRSLRIPARYVDVEDRPALRHGLETDVAAEPRHDLLDDAQA